MQILSFFLIAYPIILVGIFILIYFIINRWIMKIINIRKEQNEVLRDMVKIWEKKLNI